MSEIDKTFEYKYWSVRLLLTNCIVDVLALKIIRKKANLQTFLTTILKKNRRMNMGTGKNGALGSIVNEVD
ncbi:hypothetical protein [Leptospira weilii]|uniref:hypothetical protein n=1 Tax=Leptospira weilii TaxID=28184 RepID=UPI000A3DC8E9|nr:hypothetical protein [Leptospira weilii]